MLLAARLREETRAAHERLEAGLPLMRSDFGRDDYRQLLERFQDVYRVLQPPLDARDDWSRLGLDWAARRQVFHPLSALERDLKALQENAAAYQALEDTELPDFACLEAALGAAYVTEGATLGGQIISRRLRATLGVDTNCGCAFFAAYGKQTATMWQSFAAALCRADELHLDADAVVTSANATFALFERRLRPLSESSAESQ